MRNIADEKDYKLLENDKYTFMVTIQPLCPELCEDWLGFFEKIAFVDHGE